MLKKLINLLLNVVDEEIAAKVEDTVSPFPGVWAHIAVKRVGNTVTVYVNNVQVASGNLNAGQLTIDSDNRIGLSHFNSNGLQGEIKLLHFYNYGLTEGELDTLYNQEL